MIKTRPGLIWPAGLIGWLSLGLTSFSMALGLGVHSAQETRELLQVQDQPSRNKISANNRSNDITKQLNASKVDIDENARSETDLRREETRGQKDTTNLIHEPATPAGNQPAIELQVRHIDQRLLKLEQSITESPEKAMSIPLLKKDIERIEKQGTRDIERIEKQGIRDIEAMRSENARVFDFMKVVIVMMGTVSLSLIALAVANVFKREPKSVDSRTEEIEGIAKKGSSHENAARGTPSK